MPGSSIVFPGDNIYEAFPAVYTLRGAAFRDAKAWYKSLDFIKSLRPSAMVPSHTRPLSGTEVDEILTVYRDALQYIHDQTVRWMNKGELILLIHISNFNKLYFENSQICRKTKSFFKNKYGGV